ncbi:glutathione S-transferase family protein [Trinickia sp. LjRoot230]|uniref:glutathione S-transferase family protein n=1 Tax=Trinickia sp. LjRoot230 TaxID=3342288 RepID=UPI003ECDD219
MDQHSRIEIIGIQQSNFVRAVRIACEEKSIEYDHYPDRPHSASVAAIHPLGKVPVMRHGEFTLAESWPIVAYLDRIFPGTPMMHADTTELTAEIEQWVSILVTAVDQILVRKYAFAYLFPGTPDGAVNRAAVDEVLPKMEALITTLDARVAPTGFLAAGKFTFADALLLATLDAVRRLSEGGAAIEAAPNLSSYVARHCARPSLIKTDPWIGGDK